MSLNSFHSATNRRYLEAMDEVVRRRALTAYQSAPESEAIVPLEVHVAALLEGDDRAILRGALLRDQ